MYSILKIKHWLHNKLILYNRKWQLIIPLKIFSLSLLIENC